EFTVQTTGSEPLTYEWFRGNTPIPVASNPTAATPTLVIANVQTGDSGSTFYVKVSNSAGSTNSNPAILQVGGEPPLLRVDVGLTGSLNIQPGYSIFTVAENPAVFGDITMTVTPIGTTLAERNRGTPINNLPAFTQAQIYHDFVFANS